MGSPSQAKSASEAKAIGAAAPGAPVAAGGADSGGAEKTASAGSTPPPATVKSSGSGSKVSLSEKDVKEMIKRHEGVRNKPYKDSLGLWTVGVGHLIGDGKSLPDAWNRTFTDQEVNDLYDKDFDHHQKAAASIPGYDKFNSGGQGALTDLTFNMGPSWIKRFPSTAKSIAKGDGIASAAGLTDSKWYGQVGSRAPEVVGLMASGGIQAKDGGITDGPESGYPATLHGPEIITPLSPNSILEQLGKTPASSVEPTSSASLSSTSDTIKEIYSMNTDVMEMIAEKLDEVIAKLSDSNDTQSKLLMHSRV
jgi:lysozyme